MIKLGGSSLFDTTANFTGISGQNGLLISEVIHKTTFEIDEDGTKASAANAINFGVYSNNSPNFQNKFKLFVKFCLILFSNYFTSAVPPLSKLYC